MLSCAFYNMNKQNQSNNSAKNIVHNSVNAKIIQINK